MTDRGQKATTVPITAPVGGLNARDALANMPASDASTLTNMFARGDRVDTRAGFTLLSTNTTQGSTGTEGFRALMKHVAGSTTTVFAVYQYSGASTALQLKIYSVATNGTLSLSRTVGTGGLGEQVYNYGEWTQFGSLAGTNYLILACNEVIGGVSTFIPQAYDGASWSALGITGCNPRGIHSHQKRLWFYDEQSTAGACAYYLPIGTISGAVTKFNLAPFCKKGGYIVAMRTWTVDNGEGGSDDLAVFVTSEGEAIIYSGTDPASSSTWQLVGLFDLGGLGTSYPAITGGGAGFMKDAFALKYGADLIFLLQRGVASAREVLSGQAMGTDFALSAKIQPLLADAAKNWRATRAANTNLASWKAVFLPFSKQLFVVIPASVATINAANPAIVENRADIYVLNTQTGAWHLFQGMGMIDAMDVDGTMAYFIDGGQNIYKYDGTATSDNGTAITFECRQAYQYLNTPSNKAVCLVQPMLYATGNFSLTLQVDADFSNGSISSYTSYTASNQNVQPILSANQYGRAVAAHLKGQTSAGVVSWYATNYSVTPAQGF
jgi:hypothetical protein